PEQYGERRRCHLHHQHLPRLRSRALSARGRPRHHVERGAGAGRLEAIVKRQAQTAGGQTSTCDGCTLIEVVISTTILAVGLLALAAMQFSAMRGGTQGRHTTAADAAARSQLEQFDRMPWTSL